MMGNSNKKCKTKATTTITDSKQSENESTAVASGQNNNDKDETEKDRVYFYLFILMGPSGSGKTTIANALIKHVQSQGRDVTFYEGDDLHPKSNVTKMSNGIPLTDEDRWPWLETIRNKCSKRPLSFKPIYKSTRGHIILITCSALKRVYRDYLRKIPNIDKIYFICPKIDFELIRKRMAERENHFMKESMLQSQLDTFEPPQDDESDVIEYDPYQRVEFIVEHIILLTNPKRSIIC